MAVPIPDRHLPQQQHLHNPTSVFTRSTFSGGEPVGPAELEAIADEGGGLALNADNETQLDEAFNRILALLSVSIVE